MEHTRVVVEELPDCDVCGKEARYAEKSPGGPWAYLCGVCFEALGCCLGLGRGQQLVKKDENEEAKILSWQGVPVAVKIGNTELLPFNSHLFEDWELCFIEAHHNMELVRRLLIREGFKIIKITKERIYFEEV